MKVDEVMTLSPRCCKPDDTLATAASLMWEADCGSIPVIDDVGHVRAVITDRDICMAALMSGEPLHAQRISSVCGDSVETCRPDDRIEDATSIMKEKQIRRLPVVSDDGRIIGIVSLNDLALASQELDGDGPAPEELADTLGQISKHRSNSLSGPNP
jgi:CBS domain-containing protein